LPLLLPTHDEGPDQTFSRSLRSITASLRCAAFARMSQPIASAKITWQLNTLLTALN
jgi:hypothetical protein